MNKIVHGKLVKITMVCGDGREMDLTNAVECGELRLPQEPLSFSFKVVSLWVFEALAEVLARRIGLKIRHNGRRNRAWRNTIKMLTRKPGRTMTTVGIDPVREAWA